MRPTQGHIKPTPESYARVMAPKTSKRKSGPTNLSDFVVNDNESVSDDERPAKKTKTSKSAPSTEQHKDSEGNTYWEISGKRRVTISEFKGLRMVNIREYYEKDGKDLPGKKGISLTVEQYQALIGVMPQIERQLKGMGEDVQRPKYDTAAPATGEVEEEEEEETEADAEDDEDDQESKHFPKSKISRKSNIETTSDEED